jgi:hypothetical protein
MMQVPLRPNIFIPKQAKTGQKAISSSFHLDLAISISDIEMRNIDPDSHQTGGLVITSLIIANRY